MASATRNLNAVAMREVWTTRQVGFAIQSKARSMGLIGEVLNLDQVTRYHPEQLEVLPPFLHTEETEYLKAPVLLRVDCRADQVDEVFFGL